VARGRLTGAWPNPFADATAVRFELARAGDVRLAVYDVRGRLVRALDHRGLLAGAHAIEWDGRDRRGTRVPAGVYLYEIASPGLHARGRVTRAE
jgi:flagellar hook assembly protein FlgD